jgi:GntR family transcriptional regulator of vanillate catabolism
MTSQTTAKTHTLRALIELRQRILDGSLVGGTRLFEVALAEELAISRTPVREAMSRLAEEGLLERAAGGGFAVRSFAYSDVVDTIELRGLLEGTAARLAAERGPSPNLMAEITALVDRLDTCFGQSDHDVDFASYSEMNTEFHLLLSRLSGSAVIEREIERVTRLPFAAPSAFLPNHGRIDSYQRTLVAAQEQHRAIVEAISRREGARAEALAREHAHAAKRNAQAVFGEGSRFTGQLPNLSLIHG